MGGGYRRELRSVALRRRTTHGYTTCPVGRSKLRPSDTSHSRRPLGEIIFKDSLFKEKQILNTCVIAKKYNLQQDQQFGHQALFIMFGFR
jgi:chorismate-pyruvate lyase